MKEIKNPIKDEKKDEYGDKFYHVYRGGGWYDYVRDVRVSYRYYYTPAGTSYDLGFRIVRNKK